MPDSRWRDRLSELSWRVASGPGSTAIYIAAAMSLAAVSSAKTGVPAYVIVAIAVVLVLFVDPPQKIRKFRQQRRRNADCGHGSPTNKALQRVPGRRPQ